VDLARSRLLPDVNFIAQAQFAGGSEFQSKSAAFFGVVFDWKAWDWGATYYGVEEASARVRQAEAGLAQAEEGIGLEVEAAWVELEAAREMAALAGEARRIAETHHTLVQARLEAHAVTGFDLVEAESALTKARSEERLATAQVSIARARLVRALGGGPDDIAREGTP
jgi:outer membrane protein TolC